jgi:serine protease Do
MKVKYLFSPLCLILTAGIALAQQKTPAPPPEPGNDVFGNTFSLLTDGGGFLGVHAEDISRDNMSRYHLGQVRGVGVTQVVKDSPAEKAGLRKDDVILRIDGENVTSVRKLNRVVSEIAPDQSVRVTISRGGSEQELTATIGKRNTSNMVQGWPSDDSRVWKWEGPLTERGDLFRGGDLFKGREGNFSFAFGNGRRIGVSTIELTKQLADYFGIADGKGVLVTSVTDDGPAAKAGVKAGDVITAIDGEAVDSSGDVSRVINNKKEGEVTLTIIRNKSQQSIRVTPKDSGGTSILAPTQVGRRIVIPRIHIPDIYIPDINISMPRIQIPSIPAVDVRLPNIRVTPGTRILRRTSRPI